MSRRKRVAILISGRGSNMAALIEAANRYGFPAEIAVVISNRADAKGLSFAAANGIATAILDHKMFPSREEFDAALDKMLAAMKVEIVCLAGFMRVLSDGFVEQWMGRMINIHPSLLPEFKGLDTHARALAAGVKVHGCTVHFVVPELDAGPIILQAEVPVQDGDTEETLSRRVLAEEHRIYPVALKMLAQGRARLEDGRAVIDN
jgi:formyltetrahydrofolate-dependent phosphoribosylglycinamide formyltransferase